MIIEENNVYGIINVPKGLESILHAVEKVVSDAHAYIYRSQFNGADTFYLRSKTIDFDSEHLNNGIQYLFNGKVD